ncbi:MULTISPECIES: DMT family transporter [Clostridium]|uniref:DMT family transporter n=1 Tax=Clostridium cibarium TaxID=2762247 RepID=A0ABR8PTS0_9CLOT|nr:MULTISPECIES: DMT family transporter [Clostridium]MBD7911551.1 DMT family transporter [Clostridium cibarium]
MKSTKSYFTKNINILYLAIICTLLWGSAYPAVKIGYKFFSITSDNIYGQMLFAGVRFFFAGILTILAGILLNKKLIIPNRKNILGISLLGLIQTTLQYIFFYIGLSNTTGVKGSILNSISPFLVIIICHFITKDDKINLKKALGSLIGFVGVIIISLGSTTGSSNNFSLFGEGFIILAAVSSSVGSVISKEIANDSDAMTITGYQLLIGGFVLTLISFIEGQPNVVILKEGIALLIYLSALSAIAFTIWTILLKYNSAGKISIYNFLIPIFGSLLSALFLYESVFNIKNIISLICVCIGIYIVNKK